MHVLKRFTFLVVAASSAVCASLPAFGADSKFCVERRAIRGEPCGAQSFQVQITNRCNTTVYVKGYCQWSSCTGGYSECGRWQPSRQPVSSGFGGTPNRGAISPNCDQISNGRWQC